MAKAVRAVSDAATNAHRVMKELADPVGTLMVDAFQLLALFVIGASGATGKAALWPQSGLSDPNPGWSLLDAQRTNGRSGYELLGRQ